MLLHILIVARISKGEDMKVKIIIGDEKKAKEELTKVMFDIALRRLKEGKNNGKTLPTN